MKKLYYDVLSQEGTEFVSKFFTVKDFLDILENNLMSYRDFRNEVSNISDVQSRDYIINNINELYQGHFSSNNLADLDKVIFNEKRHKFTHLFSQKILNFEKYKKPIFNYYINGVTPLRVDTQDDDEQVVFDPSFEKGNVIIRVYNYTKDKTLIKSSFKDEDTCLNIEGGIHDNQNRVLPWVVDQWINQEELKLDIDSLYIISPLLSLALRTYDKMLLLCKTKTSFVKPYLLHNAITASFNDARIVVGMNLRYKTINNSFIRIVPNIIRKNKEGEYSISRFFNYVYSNKGRDVFSYADVITGGSGKSGSNKIKIKDYKSAILSLNIEEILFTKEENTSNGLYSWINVDFTKVLNLYGKTILADLGVLSNHMVHVDYVNKQYKIAMNGPTKIVMDLSKESGLNKKINQRLKLNNSRTFSFDEEDEINKKMIRKNLIVNDLITKDMNDTDYFFHRNVNYMSNSKELEIDNYIRNGLIAFISNEIDELSESDLMNMSEEDRAKYYYSLRGIACEGFFTSNFLEQRMLADRTERLKVVLDETVDSFKDLVASPDSYKFVKFENNDNSQFLVQNYLECKCSGKIVNDKCNKCNDPIALDTNDLKSSYWVDFKKDFDFVQIVDIKIVEDGINVYLKYSIPLANSRIKCEELSKNVAVQTSQQDVGYIVDLNCGDIHVENVKIPLDVTYFGLGGFKSGTNGFGFTALRLYNALKNKIHVSSSDCINDEEKVNEFLKDFKKSIVQVPMYNKETNRYEIRKVEAWIGLIALSPTEISQEFNKSKSEEDKSFSKANYSLYNSLGLSYFNEILAQENHIVVSKMDDLRLELIKIAKIHNSFRPEGKDTLKQLELRKKHEALIAGVPNLTSEYYVSNNDLFFTKGFERYSLKTHMKMKEFEYLLNNFPLFSNPKFEHGFIIDCSFESSSDSVKHRSADIGDVQHSIYFPTRKILKSMFERVGDDFIRINPVLIKYINIFETLSVSKYGQGGTYGTSRTFLVGKTNGKKVNFNTINGDLLKEAANELFYKEGILNQSSNIALPRIMSKQLTDIECPYSVAIVANDKNYKDVVSKILHNLEPGIEQDWSNNGDAWFKDVYCLAIREPVLFLKQNLNVLRMWSRRKANKEYKEKLGITFDQKHPETKGIYLNPVFVVKDQEGDVDGDNIFLAVPKSIEAQQAMVAIHELIKDNAFYNNGNNDNEKIKSFSENYIVSSYTYLLKEAKSLNFKLDVLSIGYSTLSFKKSFLANVEAAENKMSVGILTTSLWYITYFLDFYIYNYDNFKSRYSIPEITNKEKEQILFVFQYLLAQQNGVRAMKDEAAYGLITVDSLITNSEIDDKFARVLLLTLIEDHRKDNLKCNVQIDFSDAIVKLFKIFDNFFVSSKNGKGFGYTTDYNTNDSKPFRYTDYRWTNGEAKADQYGRISTDHIDCSRLYDPVFIDFESMFLLVNGRDPKKFVDKFGYEKLLECLDYANKSYLHSPLFSLSKDISIS
jgi:hypothetical protein